MFDQRNPLFQKVRLFLLQPLQNDLEYLDFCKFPASMHQDLCISHKLSRNVDHFYAASSQIRLSNGNTHNNFHQPLPSIRKIQNSLSLPRKRCHANVITAYCLVDFHLIEMIYHHISIYLSGRSQTTFTRRGRQVIVQMSTNVNEGQVGEQAHKVEKVPQVHWFYKAHQDHKAYEVGSMVFRQSVHRV